ncbi:MAG: M23 family metallopeptidase, partial [bacterium]|nr:M23 family metallopeptidase [bacterium]
MSKPYWLVVLCACCTEGRAADPAPSIPDLQWPTDLRARLAGKFGERIRGGVREFHGGTDLGVGHIAYAKDGTHAPVPVYAAEYGKVVYQYTPARGRQYGYNSRTGDPGKGDALIIQHQSGFSTVYGHIDPTVKVGDPVRRGQQIGTIAHWPGNEHLHFGIHKGAVDPTDHAAIDRALKGIYKTGTDPSTISALDPLKYTSYPKELIEDVAKKVSEAFGGKPVPPRRDQGNEPPRRAPRSDVGSRTPPAPQPTPPREIPVLPGPQREPAPQRGATDTPKGTIETLGPFRFVTPEGWGIAERHSYGVG